MIPHDEPRSGQPGVDSQSPVTANGEAPRAKSNSPDTEWCWGVDTFASKEETEKAITEFVVDRLNETIRDGFIFSPSGKPYIARVVITLHEVIDEEPTIAEGN